MSLQLKGKDLLFISQISIRGEGVLPVRQEYIDIMQKDNFDVNRLSISEDTWIASGFNSFVVKVKPKVLEPKPTIETYKKAIHDLIETWDMGGNLDVEVKFLRNLLAK
jgi:hypothetical protein